MSENEASDKATANGPGLLRVRTGEEGHRVAYVELFFDLVYVFAVTQLSHYLIGHTSPVALAEGLVLFLAVWWAWMYTSWATNWMDPNRSLVRLVLFLVMLGGMVMAIAIPKAFSHDAGLAFAIAYVLVQVGRSAFTAYALTEHGRNASLNLVRIALWFVLSAPLWIAGGLADGEMRLFLWIAALALDFAGPSASYWTPGLGRSRTTDWDISGAHMAERAALFIIIALGEGIIITGATAADLPVTPITIAAFLVAFTGSIAAWWIYFAIGAAEAAHHIEDHDDPGRVARLVYVYLHIPIVAGIIGFAVVDELVLMHPLSGGDHHADPRLPVAIALSGMLFLVGTGLFKQVVRRRHLFPLSHLVGLALFVALGLWGWLGHPQPIVLGGAAALTLVIVAAWEWASLRGRGKR